MLSYLQKYNDLPQELRDKMSAPEAMAEIESLEKKYGLNLAAAIMKIMIKDIDVKNLSVSLADEFSINKEKAEQLAGDLKEKVLFRAADYIGIEQEPAEERFIPDSFIKNNAGQEEGEEQLMRADDPLFSPKDEEEIKYLAKKINGEAKSADLSDNKIEEKLKAAIIETQINFGGEMLAERFKQILKTYFRGIRDRINAKQALSKPIESGGLGFDSDSAEKVLKIADQNINNLNETAEHIAPPDRIKTPDLEKEKSAGIGFAELGGLKDSGIRDMDYDLSALKRPAGNEAKNINKAAEFKEIAGKLDTKHEIAPPPPAIRQAKPQEKQIGLREIKKKLSLSKIKDVFTKKAPDKIMAEEPGAFSARPQEIKQELKISGQKTEDPIYKIKRIDARQIDETRGKIKMDDVKFTPRSLGPVDELKYMDLVGFRRLCKTPEEIIGKIKEKINLLEEDSYAKRLEGIKAWRNNPVNKAYLEIGHGSINEKKSVSAVIAERKATGEDCLSNQEFEAITDLNKDLRF
ncbi:hypothetical protein KKC83_02050 [Patescibacteria group bacterium]|nr:hypothetical protein [Candidatus Falkowbacteria bacterium]MBU3905530.1 hypothetical protein [Patescibacteria group bacterium]MCG2697769.1 hypothetical protein [Candidatus Parcubacteria bacterium]MBU4015341.1 hypothetical protein [Patescibacteria group bacterium]MBU4026307.1 hypothetical protein [Patescibacteria group bacterium]